ncbi:hypothetical protein [Burkholderia glumae]|uniref:hypothetical protein n=1 Tax=Burkholderia glumae TaxID=337 RepID=UPI0021B22C78|nr:hypothetical protein [Burkholderia glumae]
MSFRALLIKVTQGQQKKLPNDRESKGVVSKYLAMLSLPEQTRDIIAAHPAIFSVNISYELALYRKVTDDSRN